MQAMNDRKMVKKNQKQKKQHLSAVNLHNWRPSSFSTSKISHVAQNRD